MDNRQEGDRQKLQTSSDSTPRTFHLILLFVVTFTSTLLFVSFFLAFSCKHRTVSFGFAICGEHQGSVIRKWCCSVLVVVVSAVVFPLNRSFYPTSDSAVHPASVLILHPRDTNYVITDSETEKPKIANEPRFRQI